MKVAVNTRFLIKDRLEGFGHYTHELMSRMVRDHPDDQFAFYFDRAFTGDFIYASNIRSRVLYPPARHPVLFYLWYQFALRCAIKAFRPDVFFSPDSFMPLGLRCPSVITVHDVAHQRYPQAISPAQRRYYSYFMPRFLEEAKAIITVSEFSKKEILRYYPVPADKISVIYNGIGNAYRPLTETEQQAVQQEFSRGLPYFLFVGAIHPRKNVARLIEAYSLFRKSAKDHMNLIIAGRKSWDYGDVDRALAASRFRDDILFTGYVPAPVLARITGGAQALCYVSLYEGFGLPVAEAMACGVPVIVSRDSASSEVAGGAGYVVDPEESRSIVDGMLSVMQDTVLREQRIAAGILRSRLFSWDTAASQTYSLLAEVAGGEMRKNQ